ncbi:hypothetical protein GCM10022222_31980 [Amycolatopsis ultiminotia]|uniref:Transposase DDE domain-containing protein n=1 Tax=Amycolatopsis ultiminotia TaxID=543629 RepID=A0ABP6W724_9PSEU
MLQRLLAAADAAGKIVWAVSVDSTIARAYRHAITIRSVTEGWGERHGSAHRTAPHPRSADMCALTAVLPEPADQTGHRTPEPAQLPPHPCSTRSTIAATSVVERGFTLLKQRRHSATRHSNLTTVYRSAVVLHAVTIWTRALPDTPQLDGSGSVAVVQSGQGLPR